MLQILKQNNIEAVLIAVPELKLFGSSPELYQKLAVEFKIPIEKDTLTKLEKDRSKKSDPIHLNATGYRELAISIHHLLEDSGAF